MATPRVLLLGGHGKISLLMTPLMLARSWQVTSIVRNQDHVSEIEALGTGQPGNLDVLVRSLDDVKTEQHASTILDETKPSWVVWSAGAGGKGGAERTFAIDRDAAIAFIRASAHRPAVRKFLMVSFIASRRAQPPWWSDADQAAAEAARNGVLKNYAAAKVEADECLAAAAAQRGVGDFQAICLRPGRLTGVEEVERVTLGQTPPQGEVGRRTVAEVAVRLVERGDTRGWYDLLVGEDEVAKAIVKVVRDKIDCVQGEDVEAMKNKYPL